MKNPLKLWAFLTRPHPSITDIEQRRQSRLLAGLMTVLILMSLIASFFLTVGAGTDGITQQVVMLWVALALVVVLYFLNRSGRYRLSASLFVVQNLLLVHLIPMMTEDISWFLFGNMTLILSAILMPVRVTWLIFGISLVSQIGFRIINPLTMSFSNIGTTIVFGVTAPLILVFMNHRQGLERERQAELREANRKLQESEQSLERRVDARTRDLQIAAEVSRQVATVLDVHQLLPELVERTRAAFDLYHVSVFLYDSESSLLRYEAGTGEAGYQMKTAGKQFDLSDQKGLVPRAGRTHEAVLVNDVTTAGGHFVNQYLPATQAELALPMAVGSELIGVLDLQAQEVNRFNEDDLTVLTSLANQLAVAVENARLYAEQVQVAEELRAVDDMKSQFLASMSHELRTPLNAILNFTEFVALGMLGPVSEQQADALNKAIDSGKHLLSLINDVLDITKIEAGMMKLFVEANVNIYDEITTVAATAETLLNDKPVAFVQDIAADLPLLSGDKRRIRQILLNLLSNAIKFTEEGSVTLRVSQQVNEVLFVVVDTGPGIASDDQTMIFEPFQQTETGIQHAAGTGLGLPISKRLVEAHGGRMWVESAVGQGASFFVALPVKVSMPEVDHV